MNKVEKNWFEWCVFASSSVLVVGILGYLIYDALTAKPSPPLLEVTLGPVEPRGGYFAVPVTVENRGNQTAEAVHIQVVLATKDGKEEQADLQIQFVARQSSRSGYVTFQSDPRTATEVTARPLGYQTP